MGEHLHLLSGQPVTSLRHWVDRGGGHGVAAAREMGPEAAVAVVEASGLRGGAAPGSPPASSGERSSPTGLPSCRRPSW